MEKQHFLEWRRLLAELQEDEGLLLTPYEKNLEFWRQLWRVVERSDVVIQIVDARNPLLFRCEDLEAYVKEVSENKMNLILINKSDFLTEEQRKYWANYFSMQGIKVLFFSADLESKNENKDIEDNVPKNVDESETSEDDDDNDYINEETDTANDIEIVKKGIVNLQSAVEDNAEALNKIIDKIEEIIGKTNLREECSIIVENSSNLLNSKEVIDLFKTVHTGPKVSLISNMSPTYWIIRDKLNFIY